MVKKDGVSEINGEPEGDLGGLFMRLKNLMVSEIHTQWDIAFLEKYVSDNMVPWEIIPQKGESELQEWFQYFNEAGVKFLEFLVQRKKCKLTRLDTEIKSIKDKLSPHINSEEYKEQSTNLKKLLEKEEIEQKNKKKTFNRDVSDYKTGIVFEWQSKILGNEQPFNGGYCPSIKTDIEWPTESLCSFSNSQSIK